MDPIADPRLDGTSLYVPGSDSVWVVFHGRRHHVVSAGVYDALFRPGPDFIVLDGADDIQRGPDLVEGTCLVKGHATSAVFLVTGSPAVNVRKYAIETQETFAALQFDEGLCRIVPDLVLSAIPDGRPIRRETTR